MSGTRSGVNPTGGPAPAGGTATPPVPSVDVARPPQGTQVAAPVRRQPAPPPAGAVPYAPPSHTAPAPAARRARLQIARLDPWSVMKTAFMIALATGVVLVVATMILWWVLQATGVFSSLTRTIDDVAGSGSTVFDLQALLSFGRVSGIALIIAAVEIVLVSAMATLFAFLYNLTVGITGGLEVTLSEDS